MSNTKSIDWNGWLIGACAAAFMVVYTGLWNEHYVRDSAMNVRYSCGSIWNSEYPKDGLGPCTDILNNATWVPVFWIVLTVVLVAVGWSKQHNR